MSDSRKRNNFIIIGLMLLYVLVYFLFIAKHVPNNATFINGIAITVFTFIAYNMYGFQECKINDFRKKVIIEVILAVFLYFTVIYLLGILTGYQINAYSLRFSSILKNSFIPVLSVLMLELFRYMIISSNRDSKGAITISCIAIILFDICLNYYGVDKDLVKVFVYLTVSVLPLIFKNIMLTYLTYQAGYHAPIIYVITLCLYKYVVPSVPKLGNYLTCVIGITLPSLVYIYTSRLVSDNLKEQSTFKKVLKGIRTFVIEIPLIIFLIVSVGLISGFLSYQIIGVDTSAISPKIKRGDAVMIYKKMYYGDYDKGDIIAYKSKNKIIIDKVAKVEEDKNGYLKVYVTKEINKGSKNTYKVIEEDEIIGIYCNFRIPKIAYPTIWFKKNIGGDLNEAK